MKQYLNIQGLIYHVANNSKNKVLKAQVAALIMEHHQTGDPERLLDAFVKILDNNPPLVLLLGEESILNTN